MTTAIELIEQAADIIEQAPRLAKGWLRVPLDWMTGMESDLLLTFDWDDPEVELARKDGTLCFCVAGALQEAALRSNLGSLDLEAAYRVLDPYVPAGYPTFPSWNDAPERTKEEVVAKLRWIATEEQKRLVVQGSRG